MRGIAGTNNISYCKRNKMYKVTKTVDGKNRHIGSFPTLIGALMMRDWTEANDLKPYPKRNKSGEKYISYRENLDVYEIVKVLNGKLEYFGRYPTLKEAVKWRDYFISNDWDTNIRLIGTVNKNIYFKNGKYRIIKNIDGKDYHFGSFNTLDEAEARVKEIRIKGWEQTIHDNERLLKTTVSNIVQLPNGKYEIVKNINGNKEYFGTFNTLEEAEAEVILLRKSNWDYDILCECSDETIQGKDKWLNGVKLKSSFQKHNKRNDGYAFSRGRRNDVQRELKKYGVTS